MSEAVFSILLKKLGETIGNPALAPSEDDYCCLRIDDHYDVHIQITPVTNEIILSSYFFPLSTATDWQESMLKHNDPWAYPQNIRFCLEESTYRINLVQNIALDNIDYTFFEKAFERYLDTVDEWINHYQLQPSSNNA